jgi:hypothetical protein
MGSMRAFRVLEILIAGFFVFLGGVALVGPAHNVGFAAGLVAFAAFAVLMFELRFWGHRRNVARVQRELEDIGRRDLEGATPVHGRGSSDLVEELASNPSFARYMAGRATRLCVTGKWRGRDLEIGTAIIPGRDFDSRLSYVCVFDGSVRGRFRVMTRGAITSFARALMPTQPIATGDEAFDAKWAADGDEATCRAVLDPEMRAQLLQLQQQLSWMQVASLEATRFGVIVRWPGELTSDGAAYLRDLVLALHQRLAGSARAA